MSFRLGRSLERDFVDVIVNVARPLAQAKELLWTVAMVIRSDFEVDSCRRCVAVELLAYTHFELESRRICFNLKS